MISSEIGVFESLAVAESQRFEIGIHRMVVDGNVDRIVGFADRIIDRLCPGLVIKLELKPIVVVDCSKEPVSDVDRDVEVNK